MPRTPRSVPGGWVFHLMNRASGRNTLFSSSAGYYDFLLLVEEARALHKTAVLSFCVMPNHWHLVARGNEDRALSRFVHHFTMRHTQRWHARNGTSGRGHLYQARYKSFPVRDDRHLVTLCRYVERNPVRAGLVPRAEDWPWSSAEFHSHAPRVPHRDSTTAVLVAGLTLAPLPLPLPRDWNALLNEEPPSGETEAVRESLRRGTPFGDPSWRIESARQLALAAEPRGRGRPPGKRPPAVPIPAK